MNKRFLILTIAVLIIGVNLAATTGFNVRAGFFNPEGSKSSFMPGISYGINVDNIVELAVGFDYFYNSYSEIREASFDTTKAGNETNKINVGTDIKTGFIPVMATIRVSFPVNLPVLPYGGVGLGWALLWEDIFIPAEIEGDEQHQAVQEVYFYSGFNWIMQLGAKYKLSDNVHFYGEAFYNVGKMKKDIEQSEFGRTWDEINMSGPGFRIGIEMGLR